MIPIPIRLPLALSAWEEVNHQASYIGCIGLLLIAVTILALYVPLYKDNYLYLGQEGRKRIRNTIQTGLLCVPGAIFFAVFGLYALTITLIVFMAFVGWALFAGLQIALDKEE